ncbi:MAG: hypothetical protein AAF348_14945 [Bacteroidota bacterium]
MRGDRRTAIFIESNNNQSPGSSFARLDFFNGGTYDKNMTSIYAVLQTFNENAQPYLLARSRENLRVQMLISPTGRVGIHAKNHTARLDVRRNAIIQNDGYKDLLIKSSNNDSGDKCLAMGIDKSDNRKLKIFSSSTIS